MIRDIVMRAWSNDPREVVVAVAVTPVAVLVGWFLLVVAIVAGTPA